MNDVTGKIRFYNLGSEKITFSRVQSLLELDTSKPIIVSKGFNIALKNIIDKDIKFLSNNLNKVINKILDTVKLNNIEIEFNIDNNIENISVIVNETKAFIDKLVEVKEKNKVGVFSSNKKMKKEKLKKLDECINVLNKYQNELISIENEYNKLIQRKEKLGTIEAEKDENSVENEEDPLERTINFYMNQGQKN